LTFQKNTSQQDNQTAFDANEGREKECIQWLNSKKKQFKSLINISGFIGILNGLFIILQSALLAYLFQQFIIEHVLWQQLIQFFALLAVIFVLRNISAYYYQVLGFKVATTVKRSVRDELLNKFSTLNPTYIKQHTNGELATTTLEKTEALEGYFSRFLPQQIVASFLPLIIIAVVSPINWVVAVIFLVTGPLIPLFMMLVGMGAASAHRNQFLALSRMSGYFFDRLQGLTTLKLFGQADAELNRVRDVANNFREKTMSVLRIAFLSSAVLEFFSAIAVALVAVYVGLDYWDSYVLALLLILLCKKLCSFCY
jgi:ATP-binding cassette subfamily C protein CydD